MRQKTLLFTILALSSFANLLGQVAQDTTSVSKGDSLVVKALGAPRALGTSRAAGADFNKFSKNDILLSEDREADPIRKSVFYSNAKIYVAQNTNMAPGSTTTPDAAMYVGGTMKYDNAAETYQAGETVLTGDFVSVKNASNTAQGTVVDLFRKENEVLPSGVVRFAGRSRQHIVREDLDNKTTLANDLTNSLKVGDAGEYVIDFPTIKVDKGQFTSFANARDTIARVYGGDVSQLLEKDLLIVNSNVAMSVENLDISNGNRFSVDVNSFGLERAAIENKSYSAITNKADFYKINPAYVNVKKITGADGHTELNMRLYDYQASKSSDKYNQDIYLDDDSDIAQTNRLQGLNVPGSTNQTAATF